MAAPTAKQLIKEIEDELQGVKDSVTAISFEVRTLQTKAKELEDMLDRTKEDLVPRVEYNLIKTLVFGMIGMVLMGVMTALVSQVIR